jgi:hypothetical protein
MKKFVLFGPVAIAGVAGLAARGETLLPQDPHPYSADLLTRVRAAALTIPGAHPSRLRRANHGSSGRKHKKFNCDLPA